MIFNLSLQKSVLLAATLIATSSLFCATISFAEEEHGEENMENVVRMSPAERKKNNVEILRLTPRQLFNNLSAPAEVALNMYKTSQATPRIPAQVVARHVRLGDMVATGEPLVTLSSVEMAAAQGNLIVTAREWKRVENLGRKVVSERRFIEAQVAAQQARAKVRAFGLSEKAASTLVASGDASKAIGAFTLYAKQGGTVMRDNFVIGEYVEPGRVLVEITDESSVWVDARLSGEEGSSIKQGTPARILTGDGTEFPGTVLHLRHQVDETTRTLSVRISVNNLLDKLHAGQFVTAMIQTGKTVPLLAVPQSAVTLMDGASQVFVLEGNELTPTPVLPGDTFGDWVEIKSGLSVGDEVATSQLFLLKSLILKSSIGDEH